MPTNQKKVNIYEERLLSRTAMKEQFLDFLDDEHDEAFSSVMQETSGTLSSSKIGLVGGTGNDQFSLDLTNADRVIVGGGQIIDLSLLNGADKTTDIDFANASSVTYYVGIKFMEIETDMEDNPRTGDPEYATLKQTYGERGTPNTAVDTFGSNLRLRINSITEYGVDHSGRQVRVWLVDPVSGSDAIAFYTGTSAYGGDGSNNYVDIPYSGANGPLGQDTSSNPPSTTAADYVVAIEGATWRKDTDLSADSDYAFVGTITGNGPAAVPTVLTTTSQPNVFLISMDRAYDGAIGAGDGRYVFLDSGAVEFRTFSGTGGDDKRAQFRLTRLGNTTNFQVMLEMITGDEKAVPLAIMDNLRDGSGNSLDALEACTISGAVLTLTRGGSQDLTDYDLRINKKLHVVYLSDTGTGEDGLYVIDAFTASTITVKDLDNASPTFTATSGNVAVYVPSTIFANSAAHPGVGSGILDWWDGFLFTLRDGEKNARNMRIMAEGGGNITLWDNSKTGMSTYRPPRELLVVEPDNVGQVNAYPFAFKRPVVISGGNVTGGDEEDFHYRDGLRIWNAGGNPGERNPSIPFAVDYGFPEHVPTYNTAPVFGVDPYGGVLRGHHFRDDMNYIDNWDFVTNPVPYYTYSMGGGGGFIRGADRNTSQQYGGGHMRIITGSTALDDITLKTAEVCNADTQHGYRWHFRGLMKMISVTDVEGYFGFVGVGSPTTRYYFYIVNSTIYFRYQDGGGLQVAPETCTAVAGEAQWFDIMFSGTSVYFQVSKKGAPPAEIMSGSVSLGTYLNGADACMGAWASVETQAAGSKEMAIDMWEFWENEIIYGQHGRTYNLSFP